MSFLWQMYTAWQEKEKHSAKPYFFYCLSKWTYALKYHSSSWCKSCKESFNGATALTEHHLTLNTESQRSRKEEEVLCQVLGGQVWESGSGGATGTRRNVQNPSVGEPGKPEARRCIREAESERQRLRQSMESEGKPGQVARRSRLRKKLDKEAKKWGRTQRPRASQVRQVRDEAESW